MLGDQKTRKYASIGHWPRGEENRRRTLGGAMRTNRTRPPYSFWMGPKSEGLMTKRTCQQSRDECADKLKPISDNSCISLLASAGELAIKLRPIASLTPHRRNARTHSRKQIQ